MNKFFISLLVLSCFFLLLFGNVSFATTSTSGYNYMVSTLTKLYNKGAIDSNAYTKLINVLPSITNQSVASDNFLIVIGKGNFYTNSSYHKLNTDLTLYFAIIHTGKVNSPLGTYRTSTSSSDYPDWSYNNTTTFSNIKSIKLNGTAGLVDWTYASFDQLLTTSDDYYIYCPYNNIDTRRFTISMGTEYGNVYLNTDLTYNNIKTNTIIVNLDNEQEQFIKADYSQNVSSWRLGYLTNFNDSEVDEIYGYFAGIAGKSEQGYLYSSVIASFQYKAGFGTYSNGLTLTDNSDHSIYIDKSRIVYNQAYVLYFNAYTNGVEQEVINQFTYLYFVPYGSNATSGDAISPDFNSDLDWEFINSIEKISTVASGNIEYIFNSSVSGDFLSGDMFAGFGYGGPSDSNQSYGFIHNLFNGVINTLLDNSSEVTLNINVHGFQKTLYSSDFLVPNNPIKTFVTLFLIAGTIILLFQQFTAFYITIITLDISSLIKSTEVDYTFFM